MRRADLDEIFEIIFSTGYLKRQALKISLVLCCQERKNSKINRTVETLLFTDKNH